MPEPIVKVIQYNNVWYDNGLVNYHQILKSINEYYGNIIDLHLYPDRLEYSVTDMEYFKELLANQIVALRQERMIVKEKDKKTSVEKDMKKDHILIQEGTKIDGKVKFKEQIFVDEASEILKIIDDIFKNFGNGKNRCMLCGNSYNSRTKKMQQASNPFVTKARSLSGIRSGTPIKLREYNEDYCPHCYLFGILEWLDAAMVYRTIPTEKSFIILPEMNQLHELSRIKEEINSSQILNNNERWSNIKIHPDKMDVENTPGRYSTLIAFYEKFIYKTSDRSDIDWFVISIPQGKVKNLKYQNIRLENEMIMVLYDLIVLQELLFYDEFVKAFYVFNNDLKNGLRNFEMEKEVREKLCEAVAFNNFELFCKCFLPRKGNHVGLSRDAYEVMEKFIYKWRIEKMEISNKEDYLANLKKAGWTISRIIGNRVSLFYRLEKAKHLRDFLDALEEVVKRTIIEKGNFTISKEEQEKDPKKILISTRSIEYIIEELSRNADDQFFQDTKNMLLIYTSLNAVKNTKTMEGKNE